jgi:hypothetical protein
MAVKESIRKFFRYVGRLRLIGKSTTLRFRFIIDIGRKFSLLCAGGRERGGDGHVGI